MEGNESERDGRKWDEERKRDKAGERGREAWPLPHKILIRHQAWVGPKPLTS